MQVIWGMLPVSDITLIYNSMGIPSKDTQVHLSAHQLEYFNQLMWKKKKKILSLHHVNIYLITF